MDNKNECVSRPVKVRFKKSNETVAGNIIFYVTLNRPIFFTRTETMVKLRINDEKKTEKLFSLMDIDMIQYL